MKKTMKKILAIVLAIFMIVSTVPMAFAATTVAEGTVCDGITWVLDSDGTLTINGTGEVPNSWYEDRPWSEYNDTIQNIVVGEGITELNGTVFYKANNAETLTLPSTLTFCDSYIFGDSQYTLEEIIVAPENTTYKSIDGILFTEDEKTLVLYPSAKEGTEYTIPASVTKLGKISFQVNQNLEKIIIPDTVTALDNYCFSRTNIKTFEIGSSITEIPYRCFYGNDAEVLAIPDTVTTLDDYVFQSMSDLKTLILGSGLKTIGEDIVDQTYELTTIHYKGTQETWDAISINEDNAALAEKELHFVSSDEKAGVSATCGEEGHTAGLYCEICETYLTGEVIEATGEHDYTDSVCENCGEVCTHIDDNYDEICDDCGATTPLKPAEINVWDTVYISEEKSEVVVKFTPEKSDNYVIVSDNGGNDDDIDPYVTVYNSDSEEVVSDDDSDYEDTYNFYCEFYGEAGETYFIELSCYDSDVEYDYIVRRNVRIAHQPTTDEPYVELNTDEDAEYQWYSEKIVGDEITDEDAEAYSYDGETATYDAKTGWTPVLDVDNCYSSATIELNEGDTVIVEFAESGFDFCGFWDFDAEYQGDGCGEENGVLTYEFTMHSDGIYTIYTSSSVAHKIYIGDSEKVKLNGETSSTLKNPVVGTRYFCEVTLSDGVVLKSDIFKYNYAITHQPTANEPYVELNDDTDATYQWYTVEESILEITDENAEICTAINDSEYDAENGWSGAYTGRLEGLYDYYNYFSLPLKAGDIITIEFTEEFYGTIDFYSNVSGHKSYDIEGEDTCEITVSYDGEYTISAYKLPENDIVNIKASVEDYEYTPIDDATEAVYAATDDSLYACEVTFANGKIEMSDVYEGPHPHDYKAVVTEPTCTENGYTTYTCTTCNDTYIDNETDALGHDYEVLVTEPTCTAGGYTTYSCTNCDNARIDDETDAAGHDDTDNDGYCNICDELICDHNCHKGGLAGFFWRITRFFNKLFKTNQYCECGAAHY